MVNQPGHSVSVGIYGVWVALFATGCNGPVWGNLAVLAVSIGIFLGTLSLGKHSSPRSSAGNPQHKPASLVKREEAPRDS